MAITQQPDSDGDDTPGRTSAVARRVQRWFSQTAAAGGGGGDASRMVLPTAMMPQAGPGPSTTAAMAMATATEAPAPAVHDVVDLLDDSSSDDSSFEIVSAGYGKWNELLPTNPAVAYYQLELISLTLGRGPRRRASGPSPDEGLSRPTDVGLLMTLEFGKDKQFSQYRRGRGEEINMYRVQPVEDSAKALLPLRGPRPNFSVPMAMFGEVPEEWPFADPGIRHAETVRVRIELIRLLGKAGPYKAHDWMKEQLATSCSYAGIPAAARDYALDGDLPFGFVNLPLSLGLEQANPAESSVAPLFWAGTKCEPRSEWNLRFRWRCNSSAAWRAKQEETN